MKRVLLLMFLLLITGASRAADDAAENKIWDLTDYLKGTAPEIRDKLNGEVERLYAQREKIRSAIPETAKKLKDAENYARGRIHAEEAYKALSQATKDADAARVIARNSGTFQQRIDASSKFIRCKQAMDQYEEKELAADVGLKDAAQDAEEARAQLAPCESALATAYLWRQKLLDAIRNSFTLKYPLVAGSHGILGNVTPIEVDDEKHMFLINFQAAEYVDDTAEKEQIVTYSVLMHPVKILVEGFDTSALKAGHPAMLEQNVEIVSSTFTVDSGEIYLARKTSNETDELFKQISQLHGKVDLSELAAVAKSASKKKANPSQWLSVPRILATTRPVARGSREADLLAANDYFARAIVGDVLDVDVVIDNVSSGEGISGLNIRGRVNNEGMITRITAECKTAPATKLHRSARIRISGSITLFRITESRILDIELSDAVVK